MVQLVVNRREQCGCVAPCGQIVKNVVLHSPCEQYCKQYTVLQLVNNIVRDFVLHLVNNIVRYYVLHLVNNIANNVVETS